MPDEGVDCDEPVPGGDLLHLVLAVGEVGNVIVLGVAGPVIGAHSKCALEVVMPYNKRSATEI